MIPPQQSSRFACKEADRRSFLRAAGLTGFALAGSTLFASPRAFGDSEHDDDDDDRSERKDIDMLNFALNLEYLEAEFYTKAFYGKTLEQFGIPTGGTGTPGPTTGGKKVNFETGGDEDGDGDHDSRDKTKEVTGELLPVARELADNEQDHIRVLRDALGPHAIAKPAIDLDALGIGFQTFQQFLAVSRALEDTGVTSYAGILGHLSSRAHVATVARIALTEAYHASSVRLLIAQNKVTAAFPVDSKDILPPPNGKQFFPVNNQSLPAVRSTSQVLAVAYHSGTQQGASKGGFFPNGVNGAISVT